MTLTDLCTHEGQNMTLWNLYESLTKSCRRKESRDVTIRQRFGLTTMILGVWFNLLCYLNQHNGLALIGAVAIAAAIPALLRGEQ